MVRYQAQSMWIGSGADGREEKKGGEGELKGGIEGKKGGGRW